MVLLSLLSDISVVVVVTHLPGMGERERGGKEGRGREEAKEKERGSKRERWLHWRTCAPKKWRRSRHKRICSLSSSASLSLSFALTLSSFSPSLDCCFSVLFLSMGRWVGKGWVTR